MTPSKKRLLKSRLIKLAIAAVVVLSWAIMGFQIKNLRAQLHATLSQKDGLVMACTKVLDESRVLRQENKALRHGKCDV